MRTRRRPIRSRHTPDPALRATFSRKGRRAIHTFPEQITNISLPLRPRLRYTAAVGGSPEPNSCVPPPRPSIRPPAGSISAA